VRAPANAVTAAEAADVAGVCINQLRIWATTGALAGVKLDGRWLFDRDDVEACAAAMRARHRRAYHNGPRLGAGPLLRQLELAGGWIACGVRQGSLEEVYLLEARKKGWLTVARADRLAVHLLGLTLWDLWSEEEWSPAASA
jgi:hypothetical protein